jgi:protocatechuate 3,4-dioxygenase, beta subunit
VWRGQPVGADGGTPTQILGPFYPVVKPLHQDADLTVIAGRPGRAAAQVIEVMGRT